MKKTFLIFTVIFCFYINMRAQVNDTLYIEYHKYMTILELNKEEITLDFTLKNSESSNLNSYIFFFDNLMPDFKRHPFKDLKDTISKKELNTIKMKTLQELSQKTSCDLHNFLSDTKPIYLIKKEKSIYYKYKLLYRSTQRGGIRSYNHQ